ncbi:cell division protein ZapE, partial [Escherichia coli]|nr:cell division protein ZapE [Escherichia coli]
METLRQIYDHGVSSGALHGDPGQLAVLEPLERIREMLEQGQPEKRGLFRRKAAPQAVPGLYMWGGVGRGKSMLMDLFYDHVAIEAKRRVHFHAFMQEVHATLHKVRQSGQQDALRQVA